jgi:hypothetical protein
MKTKCRSVLALCAGLGMGLLSGCQTWVPDAGLTLPSPDYLRHLPTYFPPSPPFPLPKESASLAEAMAQQSGNPPRPGFAP